MTDRIHGLDTYVWFQFVSQVLIEIEEAELIEEKERSEREKGAEEMTIDIIRPGEVIQSREVQGQELRDQFCMQRMLKPELCGHYPT